MATLAFVCPSARPPFCAHSYSPCRPLLQTRERRRQRRQQKQQQHQLQQQRAQPQPQTTTVGSAKTEA